MATENVKCIVLDEEIIEKVQESANDDSRSFSNMVRKILRAYFNL